jgi:hydrogenase expression/formation protein HypE
MTQDFNVSPLFKTVEEARRKKTKLKDNDLITLAHGSGGKATHELVESLFLEYFKNPILEKLEDQAILEVNSPNSKVKLAFTTDSFVVDPIFFPGGDIGKLAVYGTVNDIAMSGARPLYLSVAFIIEEGFLVKDLKKILKSMKDAAQEAQIQIVTGDTKVVQKGSADKIFINTSGIGVIESQIEISSRNAQIGDKIILSGTIGNHGTAILISRGELELEAEIKSDTAPLNLLVSDMLKEASKLGKLDAIHSLRDPTRGGLATTLNEIALSSNLYLEIYQNAIPVLEEVNGACEILGLDPLYVANEGKLLAIVSSDFAEALLERMKANPLGQNASIIGEVKQSPNGIVAMITTFGGTRIVDMLIGEQLPRIC